MSNSLLKGVSGIIKILGTSLATIINKKIVKIKVESQKVGMSL
jgi:hypothetical protein